MIKEKFGEMRWGQWFREIGKKSPRVFVKLQNILPSGIQLLHLTQVAKDHFYQDGVTKIAGEGELLHKYYNVVDQDGIPATCPDWVEFEVIDAPFKQDFPNHSQGKNLKLPRYPGDTGNE